MTTRFHTFWVLLSAVVIAGCVGTTPPRLYTLNMSRSGGAAPNLNIEVARLRPVDALSRGGILIRRDDHELDAFPLDTWASNLGELVSGKLASEFGPSDPARETLALTGDILSFEQIITGDGAADAHAAIAVEVRKKGDSRYSAPIIAKTFEARVPAAPAVKDTVAALSLAVETIAKEIADAVNAAPIESAPKPPEVEKLHTLNMAPSGKARAAHNIDVTALRRHESLSRNSILIRPTPTSVEYYAADRWAASVSTLVAEKLESEFGAPVEGRDTVQLSGAILAFERVDDAAGSAARVKLDLTLQRNALKGETRPILWKVYEETVPAASPSAQDVAKALSQSLETIAAAIAADVERVPVPQAPASAQPVQLYTLDMTSSGNAQCKHNVVFDRIATHDSLTRADILIVRDQTAVEHFSNERWASSLSELVPEKLAAEFGPLQDGRRTVRVSGMVSGFEQVELNGTREALAKLILEYRWEGSDLPAVRRSYESRIPVEGTGAAATVKSLSKAMEDVAAKAAADINVLPEPQPAKP